MVRDSERLGSQRFEISDYRVFNRKGGMERERIFFVRGNEVTYGEESSARAIAREEDVRLKIGEIIWPRMAIRPLFPGSSRPPVFLWRSGMGLPGLLTYSRLTPRGDRHRERWRRMLFLHHFERACGRATWSPP